MLDFKYGKGVVTHSVNGDAYEYWLDFKPGNEYLLFNVWEYVEPIIPKNLLIKFKKVQQDYHNLYISVVWLMLKK